MNVTFLLNGESVELHDVPPTATLLDWLRETRGLTGTKEGCNEGDCGACTVMVQESNGARALNACILFLPQIHGKSIRTVEGIASPDGQLHPVQEAMITHHGSQCGFCTPGFITSMATAHLNGDTDHATALAGNLCRCTGYAPILRAAKAAASQQIPAWLTEFTLPKILAGETRSDGGSRPSLTSPPTASPNTASVQPETSDELARWYVDNPKATLIAGATDVGLWVTKQMRNLTQVAFLNRCTDLQQITETSDRVTFGSGVTIADMIPLMDRLHPSLGQMLRRYGSAQVRAAATIGGNIANGSPIGDGPPALIALDATLHLRKGDTRREIDLASFFIKYGVQDRHPGEFIEAVSFAKTPDRLKCYKLSKRFDQDISALCGCFHIETDQGRVSRARIAFGGMAGIPKRADHVEQALIGQPWTAASLEAAGSAWAEDFSPMSDMRASADYRMTTARNMLQRYLQEDLGVTTSVKEVQS